MDTDKIIRRGEAADRLLKDDIVMQALGEIEADLLTGWANTNPTDVDGREGTYRLIKALDLLQFRLENWRAQGLLEKSNAERRLQDERGIPQVA